MSNMDKILLGTNTAKKGFENEDHIIDKFLNWKEDLEAQNWLVTMSYVLKEIREIKAIKLHGYKTDVQIQIMVYLKEIISVENLSVKLVSNTTGFNQVDKRWVDKYAQMWQFPTEIIKYLKLFTGEAKPYIANPRNDRRMFLNELESHAQEEIVKFFSDNKFLIIADIIKGRGNFSAGWMLVVMSKNDDTQWVLKDINEVMNIFSQGEVKITKQGSLKTGQITMQRKGGDGGRDTAKMLQFKVNPLLIFKEKES